MTLDQFWDHVETSGDCWVWTGSRTTAGYGNLKLDGRDSYAHRVAWEQLRGGIPEGLVIDHLCRNRACVNPDHLEVVTQRVNIMRGLAAYGPLRSTCKNGHDITTEGATYVPPAGGRRCRACAKEANDALREQRRARGDLRKVLKSACLNGHEFTPENTYIHTATGRRKCKACARERARGYRKARAA